MASQRLAGILRPQFDFYKNGSIKMFDKDKTYINLRTNKKIFDELKIIIFHMISSCKFKSESQKKNFIEHLKSIFSPAFVKSSSSRWAMIDLEGIMAETMEDGEAFVFNYLKATRFIVDSFPHIYMPELEDLNHILSRNNSPIDIEGNFFEDFLIKNKLKTNIIDSTYKSVREIGRGGFGIVEMVTKETELGKLTFAMKRLDPHPFIRDRDKALARFKRELNIVQKLDHIGIVSYIDSGIDSEGRPCLVMPYIDGKNIRDFTEGMSFVEVVQIMMKLLIALDYAHKCNVYHRDLKPNNIMVRESDGQPIIIDFGLAYLNDVDNNDLSITTSSVGTGGYIPFEVMTNPKMRSPKHDIFSYGVIFYELLTRIRPDHTDYKPPSYYTNNLDFSLDFFIEKAMDVNYKNRYESTEDCLIYLREFMLTNKYVDAIQGLVGNKLYYKKIVKK